MTELGTKTAPPVLKLDEVAVAYKIRGGEIEAVQDVSFEIYRGETQGIVGESGCGKSTVAWAVLNFLGANGYVKRGHIRFQGQELVGVKGPDLRRIRTKMQIIFQDPFSSLDPRMTLERIVSEPMVINKTLSGQALRNRVGELLELVDGKKTLYELCESGPASAGANARVLYAFAELQLLTVDPSSSGKILIQVRG